MKRQNFSLSHPPPRESLRTCIPTLLLRLQFNPSTYFSQRARGYLEPVDGMRRIARHEREKCDAPSQQGISMFAAAEISSLDVIACFVQNRHSVLFRKREGSGKVRDFDETKVNGYVPKAIVELFNADAVF